jgi:hypothetical protein
MKKILLLFLVVQNAHAMMHQQDGVSVVLRKMPLRYHSEVKSTPLLLTIVNTKNLPLLVSPASVSLPLLTLTQVYSLLNTNSGVDSFNTLSIYIACALGSIGTAIYTAVQIGGRDLTALDRTWRAALGSSIAIWLGYLALATLDSNVQPRISISTLESDYLYLPAVIKPSGALDKLIWLESEKPGSLKISLFLPNNDALDFNFTAEELEALI